MTRFGEPSIRPFQSPRGLTLAQIEDEALEIDYLETPIVQGLELPSVPAGHDHVVVVEDQQAPQRRARAHVEGPERE